VVLVHRWHSGFLTTLGHRHHLEGLEIWWIIEHLDPVGCGGSAHPREITKCNSSGMFEASLSALGGLASCSTHVKGKA